MPLIMRKRTLAARRTSLRLALALLTCLGALHSGHGQAFTIPGLSDIPALPGLATGLVNSITSGTCPNLTNGAAHRSGFPERL